MDLGGRQHASGRGGVAENLYNRDVEQQQQQALTLLPPPSSSSSSTSSSPTRWPPGGGSTDDPPQASQVEKEHLFDKVVTPSDVGKLNRLVIPKQHAERYFPLDSSTNEKGLLLNFEDRDGKPWRFRYSYWNSSQSYVMTKGWSRFVKEKHLDAGDTVSFSRGLGEASRDRLFIDWKRRPEPQDHHHHHRPTSYSPILSFGRAVVPWGRLLPPPPPPPPSQPSYDHHHPHHPIYGYCGPSNPYLYLRSTSSITETSQFGVQYGNPPPVPSQFATETMPVADPAPGNASPPKRVRLFGVDLERSTAPHDISSTSVDSVAKNPQSPQPPPLRLSIGSAVDEEIPKRKDKQPMSLDLDI